MSLKSIMFFSLLALENTSLNSKIRFFRAFNILYISNISWFASFEVYFNTILLNSFFTLSLISLASFFRSNVTFLSIGHLPQSIEFMLLYAISQLSNFTDFKLLTLASSTLENFSSSVNLNVSFFIFSSLTIIISICDFTLSNIILPHTVLAKSSSTLTLSSATLLSSHLAGNGLLCMYLYIVSTKSCSFSSPL